MRKKRCPRCGKLIDKGFKYCPYCGAEQERKEPDNVLDSINDDALDFNNDINNDIFSRMFSGGLGGIIGNLARQIERQMSEFDKHLEKKKESPVNGISISIHTQPGKQPRIDVKSSGNNIVKTNIVKANDRGARMVKNEKIIREFEKKAGSLPKQEAKSQVKRFSNKIIYEIDLPDVKSKKDIIVRRLPNSIEVKAVSKDKAYFKLIPISLPILGYDLREGKFILSLRPE